MSQSTNVMKKQTLSSIAYLNKILVGQEVAPKFMKISTWLDNDTQLNLCRMFNNESDRFSAISQRCFFSQQFQEAALELFCLGILVFYN